MCIKGSVISQRLIDLTWEVYLSRNGGRQGTAEHKGGFKGPGKWQKLKCVCRSVVNRDSYGFLMSDFYHGASLQLHPYFNIAPCLPAWLFEHYLQERTAHNRDEVYIFYRIKDFHCDSVFLLFQTTSLPSWGPLIKHESAVLGRLSHLPFKMQSHLQQMTVPLSGRLILCCFMHQPTDCDSNTLTNTHRYAH